MKNNPNNPNDTTLTVMTFTQVRCHIEHDSDLKRFDLVTVRHGESEVHLTLGELQAAAAAATRQFAEWNK